MSSPVVEFWQPRLSGIISRSKPKFTTGRSPVEQFRKDFSKEKSNLRSNPKFFYGASPTMDKTLKTCQNEIRKCLPR